MIIKGFQKLTLLDYPEKVACTVFTNGCNFRCPFCHNASLVLRPGSGEQIQEEDFFTFLKKRTGVLDGVCVTGGEPLLQNDIANFLEKIHRLGFLVKLDTNGSCPDILQELVKDGLVDYVAMDIKNSKKRYPETIGFDIYDLTSIEKSVEFLLAGSVDYEFRTTVAKGLHTEESLMEAAQWISGCKRYFLQCFVDSGDLINKNVTGYSKAEMEELAESVRSIIPNVAIRGI